MTDGLFGYGSLISPTSTVARFSQELQDHIEEQLEQAEDTGTSGTAAS